MSGDSFGRGWGRGQVRASSRGQDVVIIVPCREIFFSSSIAELTQKPVEKVRAELFGVHLSCEVRLLCTMHLPRAFQVVLLHYFR